MNDTQYGVDVDLRDPADEARLLLGRALPEDETARQEVLDAVTDGWIFSFCSAGVPAGEVAARRATSSRRPTGA